MEPETTAEIASDITSPSARDRLNNATIRKPIYMQIFPGFYNTVVRALSGDDDDWMSFYCRDETRHVDYKQQLVGQFASVNGICVINEFFVEVPLIMPKWRCGRRETVSL